jgi:CPA1 family monovalent cation:H+ antiporter
MTLFQLIALFLTLVAAVGWLNARLLRLPPGVAMLFAGLISALCLYGLQRLGLQGATGAVRVIGQVDFPRTVVGYMLAFLLFAGAMQVDLHELRRRRLAVWTLASVGVLASTFLVGGGVWLAARALGLGLPLPWALVFGALISPTDPIAVLSTVKRGTLSHGMKAILQGEALFNDGVGIVVFLAMTTLATSGRSDVGTAALQVLIQAGGGLLLGAISGYLGVRATRAIDDQPVEVAISLAVAAGTYAAADALKLSGPIAVVAAGLLMGDLGRRRTPDDAAHHPARSFWMLADEVLNALLFLLLGLELLVLPGDPKSIGLALIAIPLVLVVRLATVLPWGAYFHFRHGERGPSLILAWGGLRGALCLALAMAIPPNPHKPLILTVTYVMVVFSLVAQGLSFAPLAAALDRRRPVSPDAAAGSRI